MAFLSFLTRVLPWQQYFQRNIHAKKLCIRHNLTYILRFYDKFSQMPLFVHQLFPLVKHPLPPFFLSKFQISHWNMITITVTTLILVALFYDFQFQIYFFILFFDFKTDTMAIWYSFCSFAYLKSVICW